MQNIFKQETNHSDLQDSDDSDDNGYARIEVKLGSKNKNKMNENVNSKFSNSYVFKEQPSVEEIKRQFQRQIESMMKFEEKNKTKALSSNDLHQIEREKSFHETRHAVQQQIERIFDGKTQHKENKDIKHNIHGVNHALPSKVSSSSYIISSSSSSTNPQGWRRTIVDKAFNDTELSSKGLSQFKLRESQSTPNLTRSTDEFIYNPGDSAQYKVHYLGAIPVENSSTNLTALQRPLKDLYFKYKSRENQRQHSLAGTLEINEYGLRIQYIRELHKGVQEIFNPFPTIAVWAAVKFTHKKNPIHNIGDFIHSYAFLPLISDSEDSDKQIFSPLETHELGFALDFPHGPLFAIVMRRTGAPKQLECHGFLCSNSEDAILLAANLYQALLVTMAKDKEETLITRTTELGPVRPPRRRKFRNRRSSLHKRIKRKENRFSQNGDVYTRVAIPRSQSLLNVNHSYSLGELFKELKEKEGLESIDDVLQKIISPNGISFNQIQPVYKELLLKLAMTMSQDEIFERSKNIYDKKKTRGKAERRLSAFFLKSPFFNTSKERKTESSFRNIQLNRSRKNLNKADISAPVLHRGPESVSDDAYVSCSDIGNGIESLDDSKSKSLCETSSCLSSNKCYCSHESYSSTSDVYSCESLSLRESSCNSTTSGISSDHENSSFVSKFKSQHYDSKIKSRVYHHQGEEFRDRCCCCCRCCNCHQTNKGLYTLRSAFKTSNEISSLSSSSNIFKRDQKHENKMLSLKKSAEMAAVFSGAKIDQITNVIESDSRRQLSFFSESNLDTSLGYFP